MLAAKFLSSVDKCTSFWRNNTTGIERVLRGLQRVGEGKEKRVANLLFSSHQHANREQRSTLEGIHLRLQLGESTLPPLQHHRIALRQLHWHAGAFTRPLIRDAHGCTRWGWGAREHHRLVRDEGGAAVRRTEGIGGRLQLDRIGKQREDEGK